MGVVKLSTAGIVNYEKYSNLRAGIPLPSGTFELLETQVLDSSAASVTFSSLSTYAADYQHLQIRGVARITTTPATLGVGMIRLNGDTGSNYSRHFLFGSGSSVFSNASASVSAMETFNASTSSNPAGEFAPFVVDILDPFETTKYPTLRTLMGAASRIGLQSGSWRNTAAINEILIYEIFGSSYAIGSRFSLYGIKAA